MLPVPDGYHKLPHGVRCRCIQLWTDGRDFFCCKGSRPDIGKPAPPPLCGDYAFIKQDMT